MLGMDVFQSICRKLKILRKGMSWKRGKKLGYGAYGSVYVVDQDDDASSSPPLKGRRDIMMAVKSADLSESDTLKKEAELLPKLKSCPHVIQCFGTDVSHEDGTTFYNVFLEYAPGGSLAEVIEKSQSNGGMPETQIKQHVKSLLLGLSFIHSSGYIHRDIKPDNVLLDGNGNAMIADFGLAMKYGIVKKSKTSKRRKHNFIVGTDLYLAPEIVREQVYEPPGDIWALGCTVVEMITGRPLWSFQPEPCDVMFMIQCGLTPKIPKGLMSLEAEDFVMKCLIVDTKKRWTADMLLCHPFVIIPCNAQKIRPSYRVMNSPQAACCCGRKSKY